MNIAKFLKTPTLENICERLLQEQIDCSLTAFHATVLFLYLLKTSENQRFSKVFRGYRKKTVAQSWLLIGEFESAWDCTRLQSYFRGYLKKIKFSQRAVLISFAFFKSSFWIYHLFSIYILIYSYIIIIYIYLNLSTSNTSIN